MQHPINMHGRHRSALERRQQDAAQRIAERLPEAALKRLGDNDRQALRVAAERDFKLLGLDQLLPVLLNHDVTLGFDGAPDSLPGNVPSAAKGRPEAAAPAAPEAPLDD